MRAGRKAGQAASATGCRRSPRVGGAGRIEHMIETLAGPGAGGVEDLTAPDLLALDPGRASRGPGGRCTARSWRPGGPTCTRRSRSTSAATFTVPGCEHEEPIAGEGAPLVAEFCLAELGAVLGVSTVAAKKLVGQRWSCATGCRGCGRRSRPAGCRRGGPVRSPRPPSTPRPADTGTPPAFVDAQVAAVAGRVGPAQLDRLVAEAIKRYDLADADPAADPEDGYLHVDPRHVTIHR